MPLASRDASFLRCGASVSHRRPRREVAARSPVGALLGTGGLGPRLPLLSSARPADAAHAPPPPARSWRHQQAQEPFPRAPRPVRVAERFLRETHFRLYFPVPRAGLLRTLPAERLRASLPRGRVPCNSHFSGPQDKIFRALNETSAVIYDHIL